MEKKYMNNGAKVYAKNAKLSTEQTEALNRAREARKAAKDKGVDSVEQATLKACIESMRIVDASVRAELVKAAKASILRKYGKHTEKLLAARVFDANSVPGDKVFETPSAQAVFVTDNEPADKKLNAVTVYVTVNPVTMLPKDSARKDFMEQARGILRSAARWYDGGCKSEAGNEHFEAISAALKECYRLLGCGADVKPRFSGKNSDVRAIACAAKDINRLGDSDVIRAGALADRICRLACASIQHRAAKNADSERMASEELKRLEREAKKNEEKPRKARKASGGKVTKATKADVDAARKPHKVA